MSSSASIRHLRHLLENLPPSIPYKSLLDSRYAFNHFALDDEWINNEGIKAAANRELEVRLGSRTGPGDTFIIEERGPGLTALADVLEVYTGKFPHDFRLRKWLDDACRAAEQSFKAAALPLPEEDTSIGPDQVIDLSGDASEPDNPPPVSVPDPKGKGKARSHASNSASTSKGALRSTASTSRQQQIDMFVDRSFPRPPDVQVPNTSGSAKSKAKQPPKIIECPSTNVLDSYDDPEYLSASEDEDTRAGSRTMDPTLKAVSKPARPVADPTTKVTRCIASSKCHTKWAWPRSRGRIFKHAGGCSWLPAELRYEVLAKQAGKAGKPEDSETSEYWDSKRKQGNSESKATVSSDEDSEASSCSDGQQNSPAPSSEPPHDARKAGHSRHPKRVHVNDTTNPGSSSSNKLEDDARTVSRMELSERANKSLTSGKTSRPN